MTLLLHVYPGRQQYQLPKEEAGEITKSVAEVLGNREILDRPGVRAAA
ncbi:MAG TPA: hypothetical protein VMD09_13470 [Solirubrobacteraceae bacterium]|nr:hypothetical protein [Solirubrobacteraceae bacterium]